MFRALAIVLTKGQRSKLQPTHPLRRSVYSHQPFVDTVYVHTGKMGLHSMETFWKYCRKRLENLISIVWKCIPWYGNILKIKLPYLGRSAVFPV